MPKRQDIDAILIIGAGPIVIGQACEFDYSGTQACKALRAEGYRELATLGPYNEDYNIFQTTKEEHVMRPLRNHLFAAGVPVENSKGEAEVGQQELNIRYSDALDCADHHSIAKQATMAAFIALGNARTPEAKAALLDIMRTDRSYEDDVGRTSLLELFDLLGGEHPSVQAYRRKLFNMLH